jgi:hypothetical protein
MSDTPASQNKPSKRTVDPEYRKLLIEAERKSQEDYDKTVLSLSGGALGISFIFIKDITGPGPVTSAWLLLVAWLFWATSSIAILISYYTSSQLLRDYIARCDDGTIYENRTPGKYFTITKALNVLGATTFMAGVLAMAVFVFNNLNKLETRHDREETKQSTTAETTKPSASKTTNKPAAQ